MNSRAQSTLRMAALAAYVWALGVSLPVHAAKKTFASPAAKKAARAKNSDVHWMLTQEQVADMPRSTRDRYFLALQEGFSEPVMPVKPVAKDRSNAFLEFLAASISRANAQSAQGSAPYGCERHGYLHTVDKCPTGGIETHPTGLRVPLSYYGITCRAATDARTAANAELPECGVLALSDRTCASNGPSGPPGKLRICSPWVYGMKVGDGRGELFKPPFPFCVKDDENADLMCQLLADGRMFQKNDPQNGKISWSVVDGEGTQRAIRNQQLEFMRLFVLEEGNRSAYNEFVRNVERACSADNLNNAALRPEQRVALSGRCANLRARVARFNRGAANQICQTGGTGLNMPAMCYACAIEASERRIGKPGYQTSRTWLSFLSTVPRFCPDSARKDFANMLSRFGECAAQRALPLPNHPPDAALLGRVAAGDFDLRNGTSQVDQQVRDVFGRYYGFKFESLTKLACAERAGVASVLTEMENSISTSSDQVIEREKATAFVACAKQAIQPGQRDANGADRVCGLTNQRRPLRPPNGATPPTGDMTSPDPVVPTVVVANRGSNRDRASCWVTLALNGDFNDAENPQWRVLEPNRSITSETNVIVMNQSDLAGALSAYRCDRFDPPDPLPARTGAPPAAR